MPTYADLRDAIRATERFPLSLIARFAAQRTRAELAAFQRMGIARTWRQEHAYSLRLTWQVAKSAMDSLIAEQIAAGLTPAERAARRFELAAEVAESAIPPRLTNAARFRALAAAARATEIREGARRSSANGASSRTTISQAEGTRHERA